MASRDWMRAAVSARLRDTAAASLSSAVSLPSIACSCWRACSSWRVMVLSSMSASASPGSGLPAHSGTAAAASSPMAVIVAVQRRRPAMPILADSSRHIR
jgi:hypothetical protein